MKKERVLQLKYIWAALLPVIVCLLFICCARAEEPVSQKVVDVSVSPQVFDTGVFIEGTDVSGLSLAEGTEKAMDVLEQLLETRITFTVETPGTPLTYSYRLKNLGVTADPGPLIQQAFTYKNTAGQPADFPLELQMDEDYICGLLEAMREEEGWGLAPVSSSYYVETYSNEENLTTGGVLKRSEPEDGYEVDIAGLASAIVSKIHARDFSDFEAPVNHLEGNDEAAAVGEMILMGRYRTHYDDSGEGRRYNIWKISEKLNGAKLFAGKVFSVNDHVGERNEENGWAVAYGIEDGVYTEQYGGGICQVSSTFYNATLRAEMEPTARVPHTIAASYVPKGMDATISTGGPDFKVKNILDTNMYVIVTCNGPKSWVQVEIYGTRARDYELAFWSELASEQEMPAPIYEVNPSLGEFEKKLVRPGQKGETWEVYREKKSYDGTLLEEETLITTSTYDPIAPKYEVGSGVAIP